MKNRIQFVLHACLAVIGSLSVCAFAVAASPSEQGTARIVRSESRSAEVRIDSGRRATVYLRHSDGVSPARVELTLFDGKRRPTVLELSALPPERPGVSIYGAPMPGRPGQASTPSFVGIELRVPLSKGGSDLLKEK